MVPAKSRFPDVYSGKNRYGGGHMEKISWWDKRKNCPNMGEIAEI